MPEIEIHERPTMLRAAPDGRHGAQRTKPSVKDRAIALRTPAQRRALGNLLRGLGGIALACLTWEGARALGLLPRQWVPSVIELAEALLDGVASGIWGEVLPDTLFSWLVGLTIASAVGSVWGSLAGANSWVSAGSMVVINFLRPVPAIAIIPIAILALGINDRMVLSLVIFGCLWPVLFNTLYAFKEIPEQYVDTARLLGHSRVSRFMKVELVAVLPGIVTGVRVSAGLGLVVAISTELIVGSDGLGGYILRARSTEQIAAGYSGIVMAGVLGLVLTAAIAQMQRRLLRWSPANRQVTP